MSDLPAKIGSSDLMPPEAQYRPLRIEGPRILGVVSWLLLVSGFLILFAAPWLAWLALAPIAPGLFIVWKVRRTMFESNEKNQEAIHLLAAGEYERAGDMFEALTRKRWSWAHALFVFNRGVVFRMTGRPRRALSLFNAVESSGRMKSRVFRPLAPNLLVETALCHAVVGDVEQAQRYVERARGLFPHRADGRLLLPETIILFHLENYEQALTLLAERWRYADGALTGSSLKALRILKAFALERVGRHHEPEFRVMIDGVHPWRSAEFTWMTRPWPVMDAFVARHLG